MADFSEEAKQILEQRYLKKDKAGKVVEKPDEMLDRVATFIASNEKQPNKWKIRFLEIMDSLEFLPNSPTLANAGRPKGQLSGCYVLPIEDDLAAIFEMVKQSALVHKSGGGTGFSFSKLRPKGSMVNSTYGVASGPVSFISAFDAVTEVVKQGGMRRGANLGLLNVTHPDIYEFINSKKDTSKLQNFNISVGMNGRFLELAKNNKKHWLINPINKNDRKSVDAKELFDAICQNIWETGEPGMLFLDIINNKNPIPWAGRIECSNPCGEAVLLPYESCNLGSIDVSKFFIGGDIDWKKLEKDIEVSVRFLDNVIDINSFPTVKVARKTRMNRKIGLGIMGFADLLFLMKIKYGSEESFNFAENLMKFINETAHNYSRELGKEKSFFPSDNGRLKRRNACLTTIAPTGTLSIFANCSSSIEPIFAKKFTKTVLGNVKMNLSKKYKGLENKSYFVSALDISSKDHIIMQSKFQKHCLSGNSIINTCNGDIPIRDLVDREDIYVYTYNNGIVDIKKASNIRLTQEKADIYEVKFDNDNALKATSNHKFLLRSGEYKELKDLKVGDSLMPFNYFFSKNGYRMIYTKIDKDLRSSFRYIDEKINGRLNEGICVHHKDWNKKNDSPDNLLRMSISQHSIIHKDIAIRVGKMNRGKKRSLEQIKNISEAHKRPEVYEYRNCLYCGNKLYIRKKETKKCCNPTCAAFARENKFKVNGFDYSTRGNKKGVRLFNTSKSLKLGYKLGKFKVWNKGLTKEVDERVNSISKKMMGNKNGCKNKLYNHKIISINFVGIESVYNMEVEETNNYAVNGVFAHNCDNAVSKTINLPEDAKVDEIRNGIFLSYELECKGLTFYRYGTREAPIEITVEGLSDCDINGKCNI